ncbi:MAG: LCP family protein [Lachnospiraceae bacterium]|nr:LCP family protein [Lachnospiraceae bacterium]
MKKGFKKGLVVIAVIVLILLAAVIGVFLYLTGKMHFQGDDGEIDQQVLESETEIRQSAAERYEQDLLQIRAITEEEANGTYTLLVIGTKPPDSDAEEEELPDIAYEEWTDAAYAGETPDASYEEELSEAAYAQETDASGDLSLVQRKRDQAQAIILMTINHSMQEVYFTTFHTDLYTVLPGQGGYRLGTIYRAGGGPLLMKTLEENYGIWIDNYATISLEDVASEMDMEEFADLNVSEDGVEVIEQLVFGMGTMDAGQIAGYITKLLTYVSHDITQTRMIRIIMQVPQIVAYTSEKAKLPYEGLYTEEEGYLVPEILPTAERLREIYRKMEGAQTENAT